jgi:serine protease DegQ
MLRNLWLTFAQAITVMLAALFIVATFQPQWLPARLSSRPTVDAAGGDKLPPPAPAQATGAAAGREGPILSYSEAARRATASVVNIFTTKEVRVPRDHPLLNDPLFRRFFGEQFSQRQQASSLGSGVIVSTDGLVLTNHHVVESADDIEVLLTDGRRAKAKVVGSDPETDLAVLRLELQGLPAIVFGNAETARVGDIVLAVGNPFGVGQTVTMGIVSALGRNQLGINTFENFIQTDAAINPGNSGGALVDTAGNLLGINTAIYSRSGGSMGIGFAIPVSTARMVLDGIVQDGQVTRGWIGVEPNELTPELAQTFGVEASQGVIITGVLQNGPAAKGGMKPGDVVSAVSGADVHNVAELLGAVAALKPGTAASFEVQRGAGKVSLQIAPGVRPKPRQRAQ